MRKYFLLIILLLQCISLGCFRFSSNEKNVDVPDLIKQLQSDSANERHSAATQLALIGQDAEKAIPSLIAALEDDDMLVRGSAGGALGAIGPAAREAIPKLIDMLSKDEEWVRMNVAATIHTLGADDRVVFALIRALDDSYWMVRDQAAKSLGNIGLTAEIALTKLKEIAENDPFYSHDHYNVRYTAKKAISKIENAIKASRIDSKNKTSIKNDG